MPLYSRLCPFMPLRVAVACTVIAGCGVPSHPLSQLHESITQDQFDRSIALIYETFKADVTADGGVWQMRPDWQSDAYMAWSARSGNIARTVIAGGVARQPEMTIDAFHLVLCHETGHFLGGAPLNAQGLAAEGQADWYATQHCLPHLWQGEDPLPAPPTDVDPDLSAGARRACDEASTSPSAVRLCQRIARASWAAMHMVAARRGVSPPQFDTPDPAVVPQTLLSYPSLQCRLDTMFKGILSHFGLPLSHGRPRCWYQGD